LSTARTVKIDVLPESARRYREGWAVVGVDIMRATTTAVTIAATGRRCLPVPTLEAAHERAARLERPLLIGELGGHLPEGFDGQNSPAEMASRNDFARPAVLLSSSGTRLLHEAVGAEAVYAACLRNAAAQAAALDARHERVAIVGAGTKGEFRREDQYGCAKIAERLLDAGWAPADEETREVVERWRGAPPEACDGGRSAEYLRRTGQLEDLAFVLSRIDDVEDVFAFDGDEIVAEPRP
jgi:2-phosphosulfolactate phosphatase